MSLMFYGCSKLSSLPDIAKWNVNKVEDIDKNGMFDQCTSLSSIPKFSKK